MQDAGVSLVSHDERISTAEKAKLNRSRTENRDEPFGSFTVFFASHANAKCSDEWIGAWNKAFCINRKDLNVLSMYGLQINYCNSNQLQAEGESSKAEDGQDLCCLKRASICNQDKGEIVTDSSSMPNFLCKAVYKNMEHFSKIVSRTDNRKMLEGLLWNNRGVLAFPQISMWQRINGNYSARNDQPEGRGAFSC
jgi:hypothetical protein